LTNSVRDEYCSFMGTRDPFKASEVVSRRGGAAKQPLSRDIIVAAALDLLTQEGLDGLSLRKVAAALDTGAASLYAYVEDLQELHALLLDRALAGVDTSRNPQQGWRARLETLLESYYRALSRSPGLAQLAMSTIAAGPNALRIIEALLGLLGEAGVEQATAAWAVDLITLYVTAIAAEQSQRRRQPDPLGTITQVVGAVSAEEYPRIHALRHHLLSGSPVDRFTWSLEVLVKGIVQTPRPDAPAGKAVASRKRMTPARNRSSSKKL
jgi:AcrR family transcriptional regulator